MVNFAKHTLLCFLISFVVFSTNASCQSKTIFASYEDTPSRVYENEVFLVKIKIIITNNDYKNILTNIIDTKNYTLLNPNSSWLRSGSSQYLTNTFYIKSKNRSDFLTNFSIDLINKNGDIIENTILPRVKIESIKLKTDERFSGVLAKDLSVKSYSSNRFDENSILLTMDIEASLSNLDDFRNPSANRSKIEFFETDFKKQKIRYTTILPQYERVFEFTYFNTIKNIFEPIQIPIELKSDDVSTHTDINPKENKFKIYKEIALGILSVIFILLFMRYKYKIMLFIAIVTAGYIVYSNNPFNNIRIIKNTNVHILPNERSTILYVIDDVMDTEKLDEKNGFIKIILPNEKIGWIKKNNAIKN